MCTLSRTKSIGRLPRSVEMITQRPVIGSLRSSGKLSSLVLLRNILLRPMGVLRGVERAFVQPDDGLLAGSRFDGQDVKATRGVFDVTRAQKLPSHARKVPAFFPVHGFFGRERRRARR